ncbi:transglycosylase domain-containing protein [Streptomyces tagetis]|uniref:Transglycosylase domain-containing protein n=1 Tax=Streptomyces tagetis TaxID=2820809 RepID=A0A940XL02_9ACTN|nr:transglycosylase domain-containing protein [Streptomyces sp. RG38]
MSDEPQPQQPKKGSAPKGPPAAGDPEARGEDTRDTDARNEEPRGEETRDGDAGGGQPQGGETRRADAGGPKAAAPDDRRPKTRDPAPARRAEDEAARSGPDGAQAAQAQRAEQAAQDRGKAPQGKAPRTPSAPGRPAPQDHAAPTPPPPPPPPGPAETPRPEAQAPHPQQPHPQQPRPEQPRAPHDQAPHDQAPHDQAPHAQAAGGPEGPQEGTKGKKGKKAKRPKRTGWRRLIPTWRMVLGAGVLVVLLLVGGFFVGYSMVHIPSANALATAQSNVYLYADGSVLARDGEINRESVALAKISKEAQHAVLAAEDRDFYTESAVDPKAMIRAGWKTATGKGKQSGSTITQQYVKNYYLAQEQTVTRKVKEFFIAIKLDREKSKDEILEGYLNTSFFGRGAYGIQSAAQAYYGIDAKDLTAAQGAYLASLLNAPSEYDVIAHPENKPAAESRWNYVLDGMVKMGWLDQTERRAATFPAPKETTVSTGMSGQRGYVVRIVRDYLISNKVVTEEELDRGGYRITTTLEKKKQDAFVKAVDDRLMSKLDEDRKVDGYVRAGGAAVDPKTGKVVAMYNGIDYVKQYTPNATRRDFQVGSTFKPFVFTSAVENRSETQDGRVIGPNTKYDGTSERPVQGWPSPYAPENEDHHDYGDITVTEATDKSVNAVYAQMAVDVGPKKVRDTAVDLGLAADTPEMPEGPALALGTATASPLDMAQAYATLANHGRHGTYVLVEKVVKDGKHELTLPRRSERQAVSREAADTTTSILRSVVQNGTATAAQAAGRPAAGKTGTAEEDKAAWFAGYTPDLATVVAVMGQDPETAQHKPLYGVMGLSRINGGGPPAEIWAQFTREALKDTPVSDFDLRVREGSGPTELPSSEASGSEDGGTGAGESPGDDATGGPDTGSATPGTDGGTTTEPGTGGTDGTGAGGPGSGGATTEPGPTGGADTGGENGGEGSTDGAGGGGADGGGGTDPGTGPGGIVFPPRRQ